MSSVAFDVINKVVLVLGLPTIIAACIYIGRKLQVLDHLVEDVDNVKHNVNEIKNKLGEQGEKIIKMEVKIFGVSASPMKPNEAGAKLLEESGFGAVYPVIKDELFQIMDSHGIRTAYDAEKQAYAALGQFESSPIFDQMKSYVLNHPDYTLSTIYAVAAWIIRDEYVKTKNLPQ